MIWVVPIYTHAPAVWRTILRRMTQKPCPLCEASSRPSTYCLSRLCVANSGCVGLCSALGFLTGCLRVQVASRPSVAPVLPTADLDTLAGLASTTKAPAPALEVIGRLVDGSLFAEFKARFGPNLRAGRCACVGYVVWLCYATCVRVTCENAICCPCMACRVCPH